MAEERKSFIDEALLESEQIEKAFEANAKEILTRTMSSEIEEMVKESLGDSVGLTEDEDEENVDLELLPDLDPDASGTGEEEIDLDLDLGDDNETEVDDLEIGDTEGDDLEVVDLTDEDDDTVVNVFKKMADEDEIEVVQTDDGVEIKDNETGAEYKIELGDDSGMEPEMDPEMEPEMDIDLDDVIPTDDESEEEVEYHIELDDEDGEPEEEMEEGAKMRNTYKKYTDPRNRVPGNANASRRKGVAESKKPKFLKLVNENKVLKNKVSSVASENETLKEDYNKMVDALKQFRDKLNEVAVFNSNLTYSVRLFTENTTTKEEKLQIIKRFDDVKTLKESKSTYKQLISEISKKEPIKESIDEKLNETKTSGSSTEINESKVYVDPQIEKMKSLWEYNYKQ